MGIEHEATLEKPQVEEVVQAPEGDGKFDSLSNRDALEKAISEKKETAEKPEVTKEEPSKTEVVQAVNADPEPPAEFSAAGKKAWKDKDIAGIQREYSRINTSRVQEVTRLQSEVRKEREEAKTWRELGKMAAPYIAARGEEGVAPEKAIMEALALIQEFKKGDPATVKAELRKIGIDLDKAPSANAQSNDEIKTLRESQNRLEQYVQSQELQKTVQTFDTIFTSLNSVKTRTGEVPFPDLLDTSEKGMQFARELGSLTQDERFQAGVLRRFPDGNLETVVREAYKYLGGKVSGEPVKVSTENPKHIEKSRRAAASTPGRIVTRNESSNLVGKLSRTAALARALQDHREH